MMGLKIILEHIRSKRASRWALYMVILWLAIALFSDLIANEKPVYIKLDDKSSWPIFKQWSAKLKGEVYQFDIHQIKRADRVVRTLIPYSYHTIDANNANYVSPLEDQAISGLRYRHWLGTDQIGRDILAGLIHGSRVSAVVGILTMAMAGTIGLILGVFAGYFKNRKLKYPVGLLILFVVSSLGLIYLLYYGLLHGKFAGNTLSKWLILVMLSYLTILGLSYKYFNKRAVQRNVSVPVDLFVLKSVEIFRSIPNLFILLALLPLFEEPSIRHIFLILGLISWPTVALLVRAETLKIRDQPFVQSAEILGLSPLKILLKHVVPNSLGPFWVTMAFGISSAIIAESTLSFLGIGVPIDQVTWGSMLNEARMHFKAWWMVIFPGLALFLIILSFNILGDRLGEKVKIWKN